MFGIRFDKVEAVSHWDEGETTVEIKTKPWLTEWSDMALSQMQKEFHPRALGYRFLEHRPDIRTDVYARPLLVWLYLWLCLRVSRTFWVTLSGLYWWGFIHKKTPRGVATHLRDLRLGPGREYKY